MTHLNHSYSIQILNIQHLAQIIDLQDKVHEHLPEDEKDFVLYRTPDYFEGHLSSNIVIGIFDNSDQHDQSALIAQAVILIDPEENRATIQCILVDPNHRGKGLSHALIDHWISIARQEGCQTLNARIHANNTHSQNAFKKAGVIIENTIEDDSLDRPVLRVSSPLPQETYKPVIATSPQAAILAPG